MKRQLHLGMLAALVIMLSVPSSSHAQYRSGGRDRRGGGVFLSFGGGYGNGYYGARNEPYWGERSYSIWPQTNGYIVPGPIYSAPLVMDNAMPANSYQSFYPSQSSGMASNDGRATLVVTVPPNATTWFNGSRSTLTGSMRQYVTLPLRSSGAQYEVSASWTDENGQKVSQSRQVQAMPNQVSQIDFVHNDQNSQTGNSASQAMPAANNNHPDATQAPAHATENNNNIPADNSATQRPPQ